MSYGALPKEIGLFEIECKEMMFYQYLPIKLSNQIPPIYEDRLQIFDKIIGTICCDFIGVFGLDCYKQSYVYLTAKYLFQVPGCSFNRPGYHSDGFMTDDINYVWCDKNPTVFNKSVFELTKDDAISLLEMDQQALEENEISYPENTLLRLDQYNIHKVAKNEKAGMRSFLKISFSKDQYDLIGNSHNYLLDYQWKMKERKLGRNIPQSKELKS